MLILSKASSPVLDPHPFRLLRFASRGTAGATVTLNTSAAKIIFLVGYTPNAESTWSDNRGNTFVQPPVNGNLCAAYCLNPIGTGAGHAFTMSNATFPTTIVSVWTYSGGAPTVDQPFVASPLAPQPVILPPFTTGAPETLILVGWSGGSYLGYPAFDSGFEIVWATSWTGAFSPAGMAFLRSTSVETVNLRITHTGTLASSALMVSFK